MGGWARFATGAHQRRDIGEETSPRSALVGRRHVGRSRRLGGDTTRTGRSWGQSIGPEQIPDAFVIVHRPMQVDARDGKFRVTGSDANLRQRAAAGQRVTDERVPPVVDRERPQARQA
jgi:hypothetical protein